jgi:hypothetical protein
MSFIILARHSSGALLAVTDAESDDGVVAEFSTEERAEKAAEDTMVCAAFPYEIVEVTL